MSVITLSVITLLVITLSVINTLSVVTSVTACMGDVGKLQKFRKLQNFDTQVQGHKLRRRNNNN